MDQARERVHALPIYQNVQTDDVALLVPGFLVVEGCVAAGADFSSPEKSVATSPMGNLYRNRTLSPEPVPALLLMCVCSSCVPRLSTQSSTILPTCSFLHTMVVDHRLRDADGIRTLDPGDAARLR